MKRLGRIYEGKAKIIYGTEDPHLLIQYFKDDATAFDGKKKGVIKNKGVVNNIISTRLFQYLENNDIPTHFVKRLSEREMLVKQLKIIPVEVIVRNIVAGSLSKRMGIAEGTVLERAILEFYYKDDRLGDPMINDYHIDVFGLAQKFEMELIKDMAMEINRYLSTFFDERGISLVDFKLEFGRYESQIILGDEITPDGCRLWDKETKERMDKDRFRRDLGRVAEFYDEVLKKVLS